MTNLGKSWRSQRVESGTRVRPPARSSLSTLRLQTVAKVIEPLTREERNELRFYLSQLEAAAGDDLEVDRSSESAMDCLLRLGRRSEGVTLAELAEERGTTALGALSRTLKAARRLHKVKWAGYARKGRPVYRTSGAGR